MSDCRFGVSPVNYPDPNPDALFIFGAGPGLDFIDFESGSGFIHFASGSGFYQACPGPEFTNAQSLRPGTYLSSLPSENKNRIDFENVNPNKMTSQPPQKQAQQVLNLVLYCKTIFIM